ncbi:MAG: DUF1883 domain-containing protein [bacterium]
MIVEEFLLPSRQYVIYRVDNEGETRMSLSVKALDYVNVFIVDEPNFRNYENGRTFTHYGSENITRMIRPVWLPHGGPWYVIIENPQDNDVLLEFKMRA